MYQSLLSLSNLMITLYYWINYLKPIQINILCTILRSKNISLPVGTLVLSESSDPTIISVDRSEGRCSNIEVKSSSEPFIGTTFWSQEIYSKTNNLPRNTKKFLNNEFIFTIETRHRKHITERNTERSNSDMHIYRFNKCKQLPSK